MKRIAKTALGALMLTGATFAMTMPAAAYAGVEFGFGGPGFVFGDPCDYYDYYDAYGCGAYYTGPVFVDGVWFNGPLRWRWWGGHRQFWWHNGWRVGTGWRSGGFHGRGFRPPLHSGFRNGGFRGGPAMHSGFHGGGFRGGPTLHSGFHGGGFRGGPTLHSGFHGGVGMHSGGGGGRHH